MIFLEKGHIRKLLHMTNEVCFSNGHCFSGPLCDVDDESTISRDALVATNADENVIRNMGDEIKNFYQLYKDNFTVSVNFDISFKGYRWRQEQ